MKLQLPILRQHGIEPIAKLKGASGGYMRHDCMTRGLGRYCFLFLLLIIDFFTKIL